MGDENQAVKPGFITLPRFEGDTPGLSGFAVRPHDNLDILFETP